MQNKRTIAMVAVVVLAAVIGVYVRSRETAKPEDQIRAVIQQMVDAAIKRDVGGVLEHFGATYRGTGDNEFDRGQLRQFLVMRLLREDGGTIDWAEDTIQVAGTSSASARLAVHLGRGGGTLGLDIELGLEKIDGAWIVVSSHHSRIEQE